MVWEQNYRTGHSEVESTEDLEVPVMRYGQLVMGPAGSGKVGCYVYVVLYCLKNIITSPPLPPPPYSHSNPCPVDLLQHHGEAL